MDIFHGFAGYYLVHRRSGAFLKDEWGWRLWFPTRSAARNYRNLIWRRVQS